MALYDTVRSLIEFNEFTEDVVVIDGTAVAEVIDKLPDIDDSFTAAQYGKVPPPFPRFFVESTTFYDGAKFSRGVFFERLRNPADIDNPYDFEIMHNDIVMAESRFAKVRDYKWAYITAMIMETKDGLLMSRGIFLIHLDEHGNILTDMSNVPSIDQKHVDYDNLILSGVVSPLDIKAAATFLPFALFTLTAMQQHMPVREVKPTRQQNRKFSRKHKNAKPLVKFYQLSIDCAKTRIRYKRDPDFVGKRVGANGAHRVRGHFKHYTEDAPLFGKWSGAYFWPDRMRGNKAVGTINKSYKVEFNEKED